MKRVQWIFAVAVAVVGLLALTAITTPMTSLLSMALGTDPSTLTAQVTSTSKAFYVPATWTRVHCPDQSVYYTTSATVPTATTSSTPLPANKPVWVDNTTNRYFAFIQKGPGPGKCYLESYGGDFNTLTVDSTLTVTGATTVSTLTASGYISGKDAGFNNVTMTGNETVSGTMSITGASTLTGEATFAAYLSGKDAGFNNVTATGNGTISGTLGVTGATTLTGETTFVAYLAGKDAGVNNLTATGNVSNSGSFTNTGDNIIASTKTRGNCNLNNASPSVCTATVNSGAICVCSNNTTQANPVKCAVSTTTLTVTGPNTTTDTVSYICVQ